MSKVKLRVVELGMLDAYSKTDYIKVGDVIEFDRMPNFETWDLSQLATGHPSNGFDYNNDDVKGTNLRNGSRREWCFHAVKFEKA
jgi:hypothetical protein